MIIIYALLACLYALIVFEVSTIITYNGFVSKKTINKYMKLNVKRLRINQYNPKILCTWESTFITNLPFSIFAKYYIDELGMIPRWSKLHRRVKEYFLIAAENSQ